MATAPKARRQPASNPIKVWFRFVPREGWPPYDTEGLWATALGQGVARIDNVPFLHDGVAQGDIIRYETDSDGLHWARERVWASGHCVVRVLPVRGGPLGGSASAVHARFAPFGLGGEVFSGSLPLIVLDVPADADFIRIKALLVEGEDSGWWEYEVGCTTDRWRQA